jgi:prevent-host-death family protein
MKVIGLSEAKAKLSSYLEEAAKGPIVITRNGKAVGVLIAPQNDDDLERLLLSRSKKLKTLLEKRLKDMRAGRSLTHDEVWKHLE